MLKVPVTLARKLLAVVLSENCSDLRGMCIVCGCMQGQRCLLLVPSTAAHATAASLDASPAADVQLYGVCRTSHADPEMFFMREQAMTASGVLERQLLSEVHHSSVSLRQASAFVSFAACSTLDCCLTRLCLQAGTMFAQRGRMESHASSVPVVAKELVRQPLTLHFMIFLLPHVS
jgi:hypothetical protein